MNAALLLTMCLIPSQANAQQGQGGWLARFNPQIDRTLDASDIDVAVWTKRLQSLGLTIPLEATGEVSGSLRVRVPVREVRDPNAWKLDGTLTSDQLIVEGVVLDDLDVDLKLRDGVLQLNGLRFSSADADAAETGETNAAVVSGSGRLPIDPVGDAELSLQVDRFALARVASLLPPRLDCDGEPVDPSVPRLGGIASAKLTASVPARQFANLPAWSLEGPVTLKRLRLDTLPPLDADADLSLQNGTLAATITSLSGPGLSGQGRLTLGTASPWPLGGSADVAIQDGALLESLRLKPDAIGLSGRLALRGDLSGSATEPRFSGRLTTERFDVAVGDASVGFSGGAAVRYRGADVTLSDLDIGIAGGTVGGTVVVALPPDRCDPSQTADSRIDLTLRDAQADQVATLLTKLTGASSPADATSQSFGGTFGGQLKGTVNQSRWGTPEAYRGDAAVRSPRLTASRDETTLVVESVEATVSSDERGIAIKTLRGQSRGGSIEAEARVPWPVIVNRDADEQPADANVTGRISWTTLPADLIAETATLAGVADSLPPDAASALEGWTGATSGRLTASATADQLTDWQAWTVDGTATVDALAWRGVTLAEVDLKATQQPGEASVRIDGAVARGRMEASYRRRSRDDTMSEAIAATLRSVEAATIIEATAPLLPPAITTQRVAGTIDVQATVGRRDESSWLADATIETPQLVVNDQPVASLRLRGVAASDRFWATLAGRIADGQLEATAELPRGSDQPQSLKGMANVSGISLDAIGRAIDERLTGRLSGAVRFAVDDLTGSAQPLWSRLQAAGNATADAIVWTRRDSLAVSLSELAASFQKSPGRLWAQGNGQVFGGSFDATVSRELASDADAPLRAKLKTESIAIEQVLEVARVATGQPADSLSWSGTIDADLLASIPIDQAGVVVSDIVATGPLDVSDLRYRQQTITRGLAATLDWSPASHRVDNLRGTLAGGQLTGSIVLPTTTDERPLAAARQWSFSLVGVSLDRVNRFLRQQRQPTLPVGGSVDVQMQGTTSPTGDLFAGGRLRMSGGTIGDSRRSLRITGLEVPLVANYRAAADRLALGLRSGRLTIGRGNVRGSGELIIRSATTTPAIGLDVDLTVQHIDLASLSTQTGRPITGKVSGSVQLRGNRLRTTGDLAGTIALDFTDPTAPQSSFLSILSPYLGGNFTSFRTGRLEAVVGGGVATVRRFSLSGPQLDVFAEGTVGLDLGSSRGGPLDLDVVAATGRPTDNVARTALVQRAITIAAPGVGLLIAANEALRDRIVHLHVGGTTKKPTIRVDTLATAKEAGLRFLVRSAVGP